MEMILVISPADEFGDEGFSPDAVALFSKFQIAPHQRADDGRVRQVKIGRVVAGFHRARHAHAELSAQLEKSGGAQIVRVLVPDDDVRGGSPAASSPRTMAATTAGRVPVNGPGAEKILMPTVSWVGTRLRQASATVACR